MSLTRHCGGRRLIHDEYESHHVWTQSTVGVWDDGELGQHTGYVECMFCAQQHRRKDVVELYTSEEEEKREFPFKQVF